MKKLLELGREYWRNIIIVCAAVAGFAGLFLYRLQSLTDGLSPAERLRSTDVQVWHSLLTDPLFLPLRLLQAISVTLFGDRWDVAIRLASVLFGMCTIITFAYIVRRWYGFKAAIFGTIIFATASWTLHISRLASDEIAFFWAVPTIIALPLVWEQLAGRRWVQYAIVALVALVTYIPGTVWLIVAIGLLQPSATKRFWQESGTILNRALLAVLMLVLFLPLIYAAVHTPQTLAHWAGLPVEFDTISHMMQRLALAFSYLAYQGPLAPTIWLDRTPVLSIFAVIMAIIGTLYYVTHYASQKLRIIGTMTVISVILFALQGGASFSLVVPLAYIVVTAGIAYLIHDWYGHFPKNPIARNTAMVLISIMVAFAVSYDVWSYFVAWPHNIQTITAFQNH